MARYIDTAFLGLRPWSRMSCAHMLIEMGEKVQYHADIPGEIWQIKKALEGEFAPEIATWEGQPTESHAAGFGLHARNGYRRQASERQLPLRSDADQRLRPSVLAGLEQHHRFQRQRQYWTVCVLRRW